MLTAMNILQKTHLTNINLCINLRKALCFALLLIMSQAQASQLSCTLTPVGEASTDKMLINFELTNSTDDTLHFLPWNSPWEGWKGRFIKVMVDGNQLDYQGPMFKRGAPQNSDFIELTPHKPLSKTLNLKDVYELVPGNYEVSYSGLFSIKTIESSTQFIEPECPTISFKLTK